MQCASLEFSQCTGLSSGFKSILVARKCFLKHDFDVFGLCSIFLSYIAMTWSNGGYNAKSPFRSSHAI